MSEETLTQEEKVEEISAEQAEVNKEIDDLKNKLMSIAEDLFNSDFKVYALDSASDIFKSCMKIQLGKSKQWADFLKTKEAMEEALYNIKGKDLTYVEKIEPSIEEVKA